MNALKSLGGFAAGLLGLCIIGALAAGLLFGMTWLTVHVYPWLARAASWVLVADLVMLPLLLVRQARSLLGTGYVLSGWVFGLANWMFGFLTAYRLWGTFAVIIGLFIAGVGVVPIAMLAALLHGEWTALGNLVLGAVFFFGALAIGSWAQTSVERAALA